MKLLSQPSLRLLCRPAVVAALLAVTAGTGWSKARLTSGYVQYEETQTLPMAHSLPAKKEQKLWFKGRKFRREVISGGSRVLSLGGPDGGFVMLAGSTEAAKVSGHLPGRMVVPGLMFPTSADIRRFAHKVGAETVGQYQTDVYQWHSRPQSRGAGAKKKGPARPESNTRYWITRDLPVPVKVEMKIAGMVTVSVLRTAQFDIPVADGMFELPKGTKVRPAAAMFKRIPAPSKQGGPNGAQARRQPMGSAGPGNTGDPRRPRPLSPAEHQQTDRGRPWQYS
jgi:hypothetical protein